MGNTHTQVTSGIKKQAAGMTEMYNFTDLKGGGELVELMKKANRTKNYHELDEKIRNELKRFLYRDGAGKIVRVSEIVAARCKEQGLTNIGGKSLNRELEVEAMVDDYDMHLRKHGSQYKEVCWKLEERGSVGETPLHVCLLNATSVHADLAKRLLHHYPKLINDFYVSDEYYGENALHMAIVNEDPAMVKFLLGKGADYHQRAYGNFFTPDDQKAERRSNLQHEWFDVPVETNYDGYTYWGEYPIGFAACLGQEECVRLLVANGADPNIQDTNGNTVLHMLVIHDKTEMFDLLVSLGAKLQLKNVQGLTPLTLAAKLARKDMYEHILEIEREVYWIYGSVTCAAYPLLDIDTISESGDINVNSAMYHVVYGDEPGHLDMIDGMVSHLLEEKWKTFAKYRFYRRFFIFTCYYMLFMMAFWLRPGMDRFPTVKQVTKIDNGTSYVVNVTVRDPCHLLLMRTDEDKVRIVLEFLTLMGTSIYVFLSLKEIYYQGYRIFFRTLVSSPAKGFFVMANCFVIVMVPGRAACAYVYEDVMCVLAILCTTPYFLFFCRGFKLVGPFVVMIYKMIRTDLIRFFTIYLIFVVGFSQSMYILFPAMYILFRGIEHSIFNHPLEAMMGMFMMSLGEFADTYDSFQRTEFPSVPKIIFVIYMIMVALLLINMLIAMMGNTYQLVNETQKEWLRQWAKIILVVEQTVTTKERIQQQIKYSEPMKDGRLALVIRWHQTSKEKAELQRLRMLHKLKKRALLRRKPDNRPVQNRQIVVEEALDGHVNI